MKARSKRAILLLLGLLVLADLAACCVLLAWSRACCARQADRVDAGELIVVLFGGDADMALRLAETRRLLQLNPAAHAFCAGGARIARNVFHCRDVVQRLAGDVDPARLSADVQSSDTRGNIAAAFAAAGAKQPLIVSDALHLLRVRRLAGAIAPGRPFATSATAEPGGLHLVIRLHWEIAAYLTDWFPSGWRRILIDVTRS
jgi:uncharacterized SAM-binding protein YcdF (DUF218 family)